MGICWGRKWVNWHFNEKLSMGRWVFAVCLPFGKVTVETHGLNSTKLKDLQEIYQYRHSLVISGASLPDEKTVTENRDNRKPPNIGTNKWGLVPLLGGYLRQSLVISADKQI